jgi:hypothetical protein
VHLSPFDRVILVHGHEEDEVSKFYLPADAQLNCLKNSFKIYIKIDIKTAPT